MKYPGGKGSDGPLQRILGAMPKHSLLVDLFAGGASISLNDVKARQAFLIDIDANLVATLRPALPDRFHLFCADSLALLAAARTSSTRDAIPGTRRRSSALLSALRDPTTLIYADPPYLASTRRQPILYAHEFNSDAEHQRLLNLLCASPCRVMLSGYRSALYDAHLTSWRRIDYKAMTHRGPRLESLWLNFSADLPLQYPLLAGLTFRDRWRVEKKRRRWRARLEAMPSWERAAIQEALDSLAA